MLSAEHLSGKSLPRSRQRRDWELLPRSIQDNDQWMVHVPSYLQDRSELAKSFDRVQVLPLSGSPVVDQTIYGWQGNQQPPAGGISPAYGWFANMEIPELAVDNSLLKDFDTLALTPTNPGVVGAGTAQTFTLAASLFGVADPLTPGLIPANVTFTQGNGDTGTVTEVPSGDATGQRNVLVRCDG